MERATGGVRHGRAGWTGQVEVMGHYAMIEGCTNRVVRTHRMARIHREVCPHPVACTHRTACDHRVALTTRSSPTSRKRRTDRKPHTYRKEHTDHKTRIDRKTHTDRKAHFDGKTHIDLKMHTHRKARTGHRIHTHRLRRLIFTNTTRRRSGIMADSLDWRMASRSRYTVTMSTVVRLTEATVIWVLGTTGMGLVDMSTA